MKIGLSLSLLKNIFTKAPTTVPVTTVPKRMTKCFTNSANGNSVLEREITYAGKEALARIETFPDGTRKMYIAAANYTPVTRTKRIICEPEGSVFGGKKITIEKETTQYWCFKENLKLTKEYSSKGLEHKALELVHDSGNGLNDYTHRAIQDRIYDEIPLTSSFRDMLENPLAHKHIKHKLDRTDNYNMFLDGAQTKYTKAIEAKEQALIAAEKKAKAAAIEAEELAKKAEMELKKKRPRINVAKILNRNIDELKVQETKLEDGTIERIFSDPNTGKTLIKMQDKGILHKEWVYSPKADLIYMKQVGEDLPYIFAKNGNYSQLRFKRTAQDFVKEQYYTDGANCLKRYVTNSGKLISANGYVQVFDKTASKNRADYPAIANLYPDNPRVYIHQDRAVTNLYRNQLTEAQKQADILVKELNKEAHQKCLNFDDLYFS